MFVHRPCCHAWKLDVRLDTNREGEEGDEGRKAHPWAIGHATCFPSNKNDADTTMVAMGPILPCLLDVSRFRAGMTLAVLSSKD